MGVSIGSNYGSYDYNNNEVDETKKKQKTPLQLQIAADSVEKTDGEYQEEYVPPVYSPQLGKADPNASKQAPSSTPTDPDLFYEQSVNSEIQNTPLSQDAKNAGFTSKSQLTNALTFAYNHPEAESSDFVKGLLQTLTASVKGQTQTQFNLKASWTPSDPDTAAYDQQVSDFADNAFASLLDADTSLSADDKNLLLAARYNSGVKLNDGQSQKLALYEQLANTTAQESFGFPDGYEVQPDQSNFESVLSDAFESSFQDLVNSSDLSDADKTALNALHNMPDAAGADNDALMAKLNDLTQQAQNQTLQRFGLPAGTQIKGNSNLFDAQLSEAYQNSFADNVNKSDLSPDMKRVLLGTNGMNPGNLTADQKAAFDLMKSSTLNAIIQEFGLSEDWDPEVSSGSKTEETGETEESGETTETDGADGQVKTNKKTDNTRVSARGESPTLEEVDTDLTVSTNNEFTNNFLNGVEEYAQGVTEVLGEVAPSDSFNASEYMRIVSRGLQTMRATMFDQQVSGADVMRNNAVSMLANTNSKAEAQRENALDALYKKDVIEFMVEWFPLTAMLPEDWKDALIETLKFGVWVVDLVLGGAVSMVAEAAGIKPMYPDWATKGAGATATLALQIIIMIVIMVVSIAVAQPGLAGALVTQIAMNVSKLAATAGMQAAKVAAQAAAKKVLQEAVEQGVKKGVEEGVKKAAKEAMKKAIQESMKKTVDDAVETALREGMEEGGEAVARETVEAAAKEVMDTVTRNMDSLIDDMVNVALREAAEEAGDAATTQLIREAGGSAARRAMREANHFVQKVAKDLKDIVRRVCQREVREFDNLAQYSLTQGIRSASFTSRHALLAAVLVVKDLIDVISAVIQGAAGIANAVKKANAAKEKALLEALIARLDSMIQSQQTANQLTIDGLNNISGNLRAINTLSNQITDTNILLPYGRG